MSKFTALKKNSGKSTIAKIDENLTANNLADALSGEASKQSQKKARKKTNRTIPFATRVDEVFDNDFRKIAFENRLKHAELLEEMLELYKKHKL